MRIESGHLKSNNEIFEAIENLRFYIIQLLRKRCRKKRRSYTNKNKHDDTS